MKTQIKLKTVPIYFILVIFLCVSNTLNAQIWHGDTKDDWTNHQNWSWTLDDDQNNTPGAFRWWTNGGNNINDLLMSLDDQVTVPTLTIFGEFRTRNGINRHDDSDNLTMWSDDTKSYIQSSGDEDGMWITSYSGNKIILGDTNDRVTISDATFSKTATFNGNAISVTFLLVICSKLQRPSKIIISFFIKI